MATYLESHARTGGPAGTRRPFSSTQARWARACHTFYSIRSRVQVLQGNGLVKLRGERILLEPHMGVFIPPGVKHSISNTGLEHLAFIVVASPPDHIPR